MAQGLEGSKDPPFKFGIGQGWCVQQSQRAITDQYPIVLPPVNASSIDVLCVASRRGIVEGKPLNTQSHKTRSISSQDGQG
jgi:hypothetical protein